MHIGYRSGQFEKFLGTLNYEDIYQNDPDHLVEYITKEIDKFYFEERLQLDNEG